MNMVQGVKKIPYLLNQVHSDQIFVLKDVSQTHQQVAKVKSDAIITHLSKYRLEFLQRIVFRFLFVIRGFKWRRRSMQDEKEPTKVL